MAARLVDFRRIDNIARQKAIDIYIAALNKQNNAIWAQVKPTLDAVQKEDVKRIRKEIRNPTSPLDPGYWADVIASFATSLYNAFLDAATLTVNAHRDWWNDRGISEGVVHDPGEMTEALLDIIGRQQDFQGNTIRDYFENMALDTRDQMAEKIGHWQMTDANLDTLIESLETLFSPLRSSRIAVTESTRLASAIMISNMQQLGYSSWTFYTAQDEIVCPECSEKHGQKYKVDDLDDWPPIHTNCRCAGVV